MTTWKMGFIVLAGGLVATALNTAVARAADEDKKEAKPAPAGTLIVVDGSGKEHTLKKWKFVKGTERLSWLAEPTKEEKDQEEKKDKKDEKDEKDGKKRGAAKVPSGPECLVFRDDHSTDLQDGVIT